MLCLSIGMFFFACSGDDDDDNAAIGTWTYVDDDSRYGEEFTLVFKSGGKGTWKSVVREGSYGTYNESGTFTYKMEGKKKGVITVKEDRDDSYSYYSYYSYSSYNDYDVYYFEIEGKKMYLYEDGYGDDLEMVLTKK